MLRIYNMPKLMPDEHPHSFMSRMAIMNATDSLEDFIDVFMPKDALARQSRKYPYNAEELIQPLLGSGSISSETAMALYQNSMFCLSSLFAPPVKGAEMISYFFGSGVNFPDNSRKIKRSLSLKYCPSCMEEEISENRFAILHASHQIPGVSCCPKHGTPLYEMKDGANAYDPEKGFDGKPADVQAHEDSGYAKFAQSFLNAGFDICKADLVRAINKGLGSLGIETAEQLSTALSDAELPGCVDVSAAESFLGRLRFSRAELPVRDTLSVLLLLYPDVSELPLDAPESPLYLPSAYQCDVCGKSYISSAYLQSLGFGCPFCNERECDEDVLARIVRQTADDSFTLSGISGGSLEIDHESCGRRIQTSLRNFILSDTKCACRRVSEEDFRKRVSENSPGIQLLGPYTGFNQKIKCECTECGHVWEPVASVIARGKQCPNIEAHEDYRYHKIQSHEGFVKRVGKINPEIMITSRFRDQKSPIDCKCSVCGYTWTQERAAKLLLPRQCPNIRNHEGFVDPRVKAQEKFENDLKKISPDIEVTGVYKGRNHTVDVKCKVCGHEWSPLAKELLEGYGCANFRNHPGYEDPLRMTEEEFLEKAGKVNPNFEVLSGFKGADSDVLVRCRICGQESVVNARTLLYKEKGCPNFRNHPGYKDPKARTHDEFITELSAVNPDIEVLGEYQGSGVPVKCKCKICGHIWQGRPNELLNRGQGCPRYMDHPGYRDPRLRSTSEFTKELAAVNPDIEVLGEYEGVKKKILCRCKICGHEWEAEGQTLLKGHGCPNYRAHPGFRDKKAKTTKQFAAELAAVHPELELTGEYTGYRDKISCRCKTCGYEWSVLPVSLIKGSGCPKCKKNN